MSRSYDYSEKKTWKEKMAIRAAATSAAGLLTLGMLSRFIWVARPNQVFAVTGWMIGAGDIMLRRRAIVLPLIQMAQPIDLTVRQLDFSVDGTSKDMLGVAATFSMTVKPNDEDEAALKKYAKYICNIDQKQFERFLQEQSMGAFREVMANRTAMEIFSSREEVKKIVAETFNIWLSEIGMKSIAMAITNIADPKQEGKEAKECKGVKGYFRILEEAKLAEANATAIQRQSAAETTAGQAVSEKDIAVSEFRRKADEVRATNLAAVAQKEQEVKKAVELARQAAAIEAERAAHVPAAIAIGEAAVAKANAEKQVIETQAKAQQVAALEAAKAFEHLRGADALPFYLHQTGKYERYLGICTQGVKDMKPAVHVIQTGDHASKDNSGLGKIVTDLYASSLPPALQANHVLGLFDRKPVIPEFADKAAELKVMGLR